MNTSFQKRHIGPGPEDTDAMLRTIGASSLETLIEQTIPADIRLKKPMNLPEPLGEHELLNTLREIADENQVFRSYIGMGYHNCITPGVIQRNILENPAWYTSYTPYQAEIAQGRLEALLNFQTMVTDLTGLMIANASLLDEGTAAAEAMHMFFASKPDGQGDSFFVSHECLPQTIEVLRTRSAPLGIRLIVGDWSTVPLDRSFFGALVQYPTCDGLIHDYGDFAGRVHEAGAFLVAAADILSLVLLKPPGEWGADAAVGSTQRFGIPMGYGGPHAAYLSTRDDFKRKLPGRLIGVTIDAREQRALRMALQTREQHIRREKATSNICTSQVLLANMAGMYAVYHGPEGLKAIARRIHRLAAGLSAALENTGFRLLNTTFFDTLRVEAGEAVIAKCVEGGLKRGINFRRMDSKTLGISIDETTGPKDIQDMVELFATAKGSPVTSILDVKTDRLPPTLVRTSSFLQHPVFNRYHSETDMLRYIKSLELKDFSLANGMIPLGSCTMKLNATAEMFPVTWSEFGNLHPFAPLEQARGYARLFSELEGFLNEITGFAATSLQPNAGAQGEYTGLMVIREYFRNQGAPHRNVALIPSSAHGTNPASAVMAGLQVVVVKCDDHGNIDVADLRDKAAQYKETLAALMVTYPSTHGVFEESIRDICRIVHDHGGQVYMDGANMNAQVGLTSPAMIGADVCHLNLHKTFCIPHGGGGPGVGPICVAKHLAPFLPTHPMVRTGGDKGITPVAAAPWGSASILWISYVYIRLMGAAGLADATRYAILNANYIKERLKGHYQALYAGAHGRVGHEMILDTRHFKSSAGVDVIDIAKRLMDYGFHAPTVSFPVPGTLMVEPTESESKYELDRFCDAMIAIRREIDAIEKGLADKNDNVLKNAPHTAESVVNDAWPHAYSREQAAFPLAGLRHHKFWPSVSRVNDAYGDRNVVCTCPPMEAYEEAGS